MVEIAALTSEKRVDFDAILKKFELLIAEIYN